MLNATTPGRLVRSMSLASMHGHHALGKSHFDLPNHSTVWQKTNSPNDTFVMANK